MLPKQGSERSCVGGPRESGSACWRFSAWPARFGGSAIRPAGPADLPRYDLNIVLDVGKHVVTANEVVTWTNNYRTPFRKSSSMPIRTGAWPPRMSAFLPKSARFCGSRPRNRCQPTAPLCKSRRLIIAARSRFVSLRRHWTTTASRCPKRRSRRRRCFRRCPSRSSSRSASRPIFSIRRTMRRRSPSICPRRCRRANR